MLHKPQAEPSPPLVAERALASATSLMLADACLEGMPNLSGRNEPTMQLASVHRKYIYIKKYVLFACILTS
jgi:hypothetical protein